MHEGEDRGGAADRMHPFAEESPGKGDEELPEFRAVFEVDELPEVPKVLGSNAVAGSVGDEVSPDVGNEELPEVRAVFAVEHGYFGDAESSEVGQMGDEELPEFGFAEMAIDRLYRCHGQFGWHCYQGGQECMKVFDP